MNEVSLLFGPERQLVGTLTRPGASVVPAAGEPVAFILFNAGVIHRIGPHRINVKLARRLAQLGVTTLRFDLSGQGDSRNASSALDYREQAVADLRAAMDHIERSTEIRRFVIGGICSGADNAWTVAQRDPRVVGIWLMDGYSYPSRKTPWVRWAKRLRGPLLGALKPALARRLAALRPKRPSEDESVTDYGRQVPSRDEYARTMQALVDRGVQVQLIYTGSMLPQYNHDSQFNDVFGQHAFAAKVRCAYRPDIDHTVTPLAAQAALIELLAGFALGVQGPG